MRSFQRSRIASQMLGFALLMLNMIAVTDVVRAENVYVLRAQQRLKELGYDPGPIDGLFGAKTAAALKLYQGDKGLPKTGLLDKKTAESLGVSAFRPVKKTRKSSKDLTPLIEAISKGQQDAAVKLILKGADVNAKMKNGDTALKLAKKKNHIKIIELLKLHGAKE